MATDRRVFPILLQLSLFTLLVIAALRSILRDSHMLFAPIFYAFPLPVLAGCFGLNWFLLKRCRKSRSGNFAFVSGALCLGIWAFPLAKHHSPSSSQKSFSIMFWNMAHPKHPFVPLIEAIRADKPDIVALVETAVISKEAEKSYAEQLPGYQLAVLPNGMAAFCKGLVSVTSTNSLSYRSAINVVQCEFADQKLPLMIVDVGAKPYYPRKPTLERVFAEAKKLENVIIAGDFNTPYESMHFDPFRARYHHALAEAGSGTMETWPVGIPLLAIDHVWSSEKIVPIRARKFWSFNSDHARLLVDVARKP